MSTPSPVDASPKDRSHISRWWRRRTELGFAFGVIGVAIFFTVEALKLPGSDESGTPGPAFFPWIVTIFLYVTGAFLAVNVIRNPREGGPGAAGSSISTDMLEDLGGLDDTGEMTIVRTPRGSFATADTTSVPPNIPPATPPTDVVDEPAPAPAGTDYIPVDYRTVGIVLAGLIGFILLLQPVGWLLCAAALFWVVCYALGSERPVFDIGVAIIFASLTQLAFSAGLGLNLPAGFLEGLLPWTS